MFDLSKTLAITLGMLLRPRQTWEEYYPESENWLLTLGVVTIPLVLISSMFAFMGAAFAFESLFGASIGLGVLITLVLNSAVGIGICVLVFTVFAGLFSGKMDFARGLAAVSLTGVPAVVGTMLTPVPFIGILLMLALAIYSFILFYKIIPRYLAVPRGKRGLHFATSIVVCMVAAFIMSPLAILNLHASDVFPEADEELSRLSDSRPGIMRNFEQAEDVMKRADEDTYEPPADGRLTEDQVTHYIDVMKEAKALRQGEESKMAGLEESAKNGGTTNTVSSFIDDMSGIATWMNLGLAEVMAVKERGGNWAEHRWIQRQLDSARIQKDHDDRSQHNYGLYQRYRSELNALKS